MTPPPLLLIPKCLNSSDEMLWMTENGGINALVIVLYL